MISDNLSEKDKLLLTKFKSLVRSVSLPDSSALLMKLNSDENFKSNTRFYRLDQSLTYEQALQDSTESITRHFRRLQNFFSDIQSICTELESATHAKVSCNAFLSPKNSQALNAHEDLDDSLVFQAEGEKIWKIWKPYSNELTISRMARDKASGTLEGWLKTSVPTELTLKAGDSFLLKAGHPHKAATENASSLHYTFLLIKEISGTN